MSPSGLIGHLKGGGAPWRKFFRKWDPRYRELELILSRKALSPQLGRLLRFIVVECVEGRAGRLSEESIAEKVFQHRDFVATEKSVVRVEKHRLKERLREYYAEQGANDPLVITLGASFVPIFAKRGTEQSRQRSWRTYALWGSPLLVLGMLAIWWSTGKPNEELVLTRLTYDSGLTTDPAISPDGKLVAYASDRRGEGNLDIWVQNITTGDRVLLAPNAADDFQPSFSPDGSKVVFRSDRDGGGIYVVAVLGGDLRLVAKDGRGPRFSPDGRSIAYWVGEPYFIRTQVFVVPAGGGTPVPVTPDLYGAHHAVWSPEGEHILLLGQQTADSAPDWWLVDPAKGTSKTTGAVQFLASNHLTAPGPAAWAGNRVYFAGHGDTTNLWTAPVSHKTGELSGQPRRLTFGTAQEDHPSVAADGSFVFSSAVSSVNVWSVPAEANTGRITGEPQRLTRDLATEVFPSLSANGKLVFDSDRSGTREIWIKDLKTGTETRIAPSQEEYDSPKITPDGAKIAYAVSNPQWAIHVLNLSTGAEQSYREGGPPRGFSPDGTKLLYEAKDCSPYCIGMLDLTTGKSSHLIAHKRYALYPESFSPDGRWIAFQVRRRDNDLTRSICVVATDRAANSGEEGWAPVTDGTSMDREAKWSPDGNLIYMISERDGFRCIWAQRLDSKTKRGSGPPFAVEHFHHSRESLSFGSPGKTGFTVMGDRLVYSRAETTGNIWLARRR